MLTDDELNSILKRAEYSPIEIGQIPWHDIQHLMITDPSSWLRGRDQTTTGVSEMYYNDKENWLLVVWPSPDEVHKLITHCPETLEKLQILNLNMPSLPPMEHLSHLTSLDFTGCKSLVELQGLNNLPLLTRLDFTGCRSLSTLPQFEKSTQLTELCLSQCENLVTLPALENFPELTELNLSHCRHLKFLPESIRNLKNLHFLNLSFTCLEDLPDWLPEIASSFTTANYIDIGSDKAAVWLHGTTVDAITDMSLFDHPYKLVAKWFKERQLGRSQSLNEIKVVFLGDGEAGKSRTIARLMNDGGDPDPLIFDGQSTPGIVIRNKEYDLNGRKIQVHYWDFGGQEIMHSMHRIFLTGRTMYVVLLNARDDTQGDRAKYWLHNIKSFAPDAPVLLVLNKIDQNENASVDEVDLRGRYKKLTKIVRLSALKYSQEEFTEKFTEVLLEEIKNTGYLDAQWPAAWVKVKEQLEHMDGNYILGDAYQAICETCQVDDNQKNLLHWFNDLGVSFCCCDDGDYALEDYVILRPDWITNALYIILFNKLEGAKNGLISHASIHRILRSAHNNPNVRCTLPKARYNGNDIQYVLGVMRKFNLSFPHGINHEFIPMLCQQNSTVDVQYYHKDENTLEFNMEFDYLPNNLLHRLMVERHSELDMNNVWRTGARFQLPELGLSAVVVIDSNTLRFFIRHTDPMHKSNTYLAMLKANVDRIVKAMGLKAPECKLVYKIHGTRAVFSYDRLLKMHARGRKEEYCEDLDEDFLIEDILNQSAPESLEGEQKLLDAIHKSCLNIQGDMRYRGSDEDDRNTRIRDDLRYIGYVVHDQTRQGTTESGKRAGELDLEIRRENGLPWTIVESLRISNGAKANWNKHLDKLVDSYNAHGLRTLFLIAFADCDKDRFKSIWNGYKDDHIQGHDSGRFSYVANSFREISEKSENHLKIATSDYNCGGNIYRVYHIFVQMEPQ